jgi:CBS domain-containing protein
MKNTIAERILDFLKDFPPFDLLNKEQLFEIASTIKVHYLEQGKTVFYQKEEPHNSFYIVKDGAIGLYRKIDDIQILIDICDEGDIFGLRPLVQNDHYLMSAISNEESILYAIPVKSLEQIIPENDKVRKFLIASFSSNIKTPYAKENNGQLFANIDNIQSNADLSDVQTAQYSKNPITCSKNNTIQQAAEIMSEKRVGSILIVEDNRPIGIITDKDLRLKIATGAFSILSSVTEVMSSPVITVHKNITVAEAQIQMIKHKITHLCITQNGTPDSDLVGVMSEHDIVVLHGNNPSVLIKEVKRAKNIEALKYIRQKASELLKRYIEQNIPIIFISKIISEINEVITQKIIEISLGEMKEKPPVKFAWLGLGSQGRREQLLLTDQDNALVFEDVPTNEYDNTKHYFIQLAKKITSGLHEIGFENCPAGMMGSNPRWCLSLSQWKEQFNQWITTPTEEAVMMCTIFFDYSKLYGDEKLISKMSKSIFKSIKKYEIFLNFLGKNALINPPPLGFFRQFLVEHDGAHKDQFDLKSRALMPLIDAARLLILSYNIKNKNNTIERFTSLAELEPQNEDLYYSCIDSFKILLHHRTKQGLTNNNSGRYVDLDSLNKSERLKLKGCFKPIKDIQELIKIRFKLAQMM